MYSASSHFIYKDSPLPLVQSDRFSLELGLDSSKMFTKVDRKADISLFPEYYLKFSDIDILVYFW